MEILEGETKNINMAIQISSWTDKLIKQNQIKKTYIPVENSWLTALIKRASEINQTPYLGTLEGRQRLLHSSKISVKTLDIECVLFQDDAICAESTHELVTKEKHGACGEDGSCHNSEWSFHVSEVSNNENTEATNIREISPENESCMTLEDDTDLQHKFLAEQNFSVTTENYDFYGENGSNFDDDIGETSDVLGNRTLAKGNCSEVGNNRTEQKTTATQNASAVRSTRKTTKRRNLDYQHNAENQGIKIYNRFNCLFRDDPTSNKKDSNKKKRGYGKQRTCSSKIACTKTKKTNEDSIEQSSNTQDNDHNSDDVKVRRSYVFQDNLRGGYKKHNIWLLLVLMVVGCYGDSISLLSGDPIVFGRNVTLQCCISKQATLNHLAWMRRDDGQVLANDIMSTDPMKFESDIKYIDDRIAYRLTILKFNESDVDPLYKCTFGFDALKLNLSINEDNFRYFPLETDIMKKIEFINDMVNVSIIINKIYPVPVCRIHIEEMSLNMDLNTTIESKHSLYMANLAFVSMPLKDLCSVTVAIKCGIGNEIKEIVTERLENCKKKKPDFQRMILVPVLVIIAIFIAGGGGYFIIMKKRRSRSIRKRNQHNTKNEGLLNNYNSHDAIT